MVLNRTIKSATIRAPQLTRVVITRWLEETWLSNLVEDC